MNTKVIEQLAKLAGIPVGELTSAIESDSAEIKVVQPFKTFTNDEWDSFEESVGKENDDQYNKGKEVGVRQWVRDTKEAEGLTFEGKDGSKLIQHLKEKALNDADKNPDERIKTLTRDLEILRETSTKDIEAKEKAALESDRKYKNLKNASKINELVPNTPKGMSQDDAVFLMKREFSFETDEDGNEVVMKGDQVIKDKTRNPVSWEQGVKDFWIEKDWIVKADGRGEKPKNTTDPSNFKKMSDIDSYLEDNKIDPKSQEATALLNEASKAKDFDVMS